MNVAVARFETRVFDILHAAGNDHVRQSLLAVTRNLDLEGTRANELARRAGMTRQAMSELIGQAEVKGIVTRVDDPIDRRAKIVHFTSRGARWLDAFREAIAKATAEMEIELGPGAFTSLLVGLRSYALAGC